MVLMFISLNYDNYNGNRKINFLVSVIPVCKIKKLIVRISKDNAWMRGGIFE